MFINKYLTMTTKTSILPKINKNFCLSDNLFIKPFFKDYYGNIIIYYALDARTCL